MTNSNNLPKNILGSLDVDDARNISNLCEKKYGIELDSYEGFNSGPERIIRLYSIISALDHQSFSDIDSMLWKKIHSLYEHKGMLQVNWKTKPNDKEIRLVEELFNDGENHCHTIINSQYKFQVIQGDLVINEDEAGYL